MARNPWLRPAGADGFVAVRVLWERFAAVYGTKWRLQFPDEASQVVWGESAAALFYARGIQYRMLKPVLDRLLATVRADSVPPSLAELADMVLPAIDFAAAFDEARVQAPLVLLGAAVWSQPAIYWAARDFGLNRIAAARWGRSKGDWVRLLSKRLASTCPAVPANVPPPEYKRGNAAVAAASVAQLKEMLAAKAA
ncbi:hypothetical protein [Jeongeupia naejangsanensis]|uniref:Uncharacterized protein n=1 Tax=Jeongeupia naejangsanensis TaxID=613195 RepID=A0ABS2BF75_9NEIS|nr:hypothetical protein [Jeongeupia naejangsanensis]MBM3114264.1 hypothetical protein [Jeongeupia naejangsanensis]